MSLRWRAVGNLLCLIRLVRGLNLRPPAPEANALPLDQLASNVKGDYLKTQITAFGTTKCMQVKKAFVCFILAHLSHLTLFHCMQICLIFRRALQIFWRTMFRFFPAKTFPALAALTSLSDITSFTQCFEKKIFNPFIFYKKVQLYRWCSFGDIRD